jgi:hypothetical protein
MRLRLAPDSRILIDLRGAGVLRALTHSPTLVARPEPLEVVVDGGGERFASDLEARVLASSIEPPADIASSDREKMRDNLLGPEVLDAGRFPALVLRGRYEGSLAGGTLAGRLDVRGTPRSITLPIAVARSGGVLVATGTWEGRLTELGVPPFRALFGAIRLGDWIRLRVEARFAAVDS